MANIYTNALQEKKLCVYMCIPLITEICEHKGAPRPLFFPPAYPAITFHAQAAKFGEKCCRDARRQNRNPNRLAIFHAVNAHPAELNAGNWRRKSKLAPQYSAARTHSKRNLYIILFTFSAKHRSVVIFCECAYNLMMASVES